MFFKNNFMLNKVPPLSVDLRVCIFYRLKEVSSEVKMQRIS